MKQFTIPFAYRSPMIAAIKKKRKELDKLKKDFSPALLDFGAVQIYLARHFGFCYGVENAIEIAFRTVEENQGKRIFLLSEMIHNPQVNADLVSKGIQFLQDTHGKQIISFDELRADDIVIIPAFGTTLAIESILKEKGIAIEKYNTTCPFVEKVWNRSAQIAEKNYTVVVHGKPTHEETRATFSHSAAATPTVVVNDMKEAQSLAQYITEEKNVSEFYIEFEGKYSENFDVTKHFERIGVVNQTTMLATDTQAIADYLKMVMLKKYAGDTKPEDRFADTRDTLCYATNDNQSAVYGLLNTPADFAIVVGGYKSSNTSHLVELCEEKLTTYYIESEANLLSENQILHYNFHEQKEYVSAFNLKGEKPVRVLITSGASCPDAMVEAVITKLVGYFNVEISVEKIIADFS